MVSVAAGGAASGAAFGAASGAAFGAASFTSTSGTFSFSFSGEPGSATAALAAAGAASVGVAAGGGAPLKTREISSKVLPFVSGTLMKVKMKKMIRKAVKMRKTQGPHHS